MSLGNPRAWRGHRVPRYLRPVLALYAALSLALWPVPLLNVLHAESSAVVAAVAFFGAGLTSLRAFQQGGRLAGVLAAQLAALTLPWMLLTVTVLWAPNCGYALGLLLFVLFPGVTVVLAVASAYLLASSTVRRRRMVLVAAGLATIVLGPLYDLGLHPQFYTYNHVFGGVLGPIYDEELAVRSGLFVFRGLTLLWALLAVLIGRLLRARRGMARGSAASGTLRGAAATAVLIVLGYVFAAPLGLNTPAWYLQRALGGHIQTAHFDIYFDPAALEPDEVRRLALDHEYRYRWLAGRLDVEVPERIASYVYPSPEVKAQLTGARYTNVAPVWLPRPQSHVLFEHFDRVFGHELVHVFSRRFGLPVINASVSVGLVEGLAEALEPPDGRPSLDEQVAAAALQRVGVRGDDAYVLAGEVASRLSPFGFWTGRGAVSYTTMGSFVAYLLERYGPARLRAVYAWGDFDAVYGKSLQQLAREWEQAVYSLPVMARDAAPLARVRFSQPSLFEVRCPHHVPSYRRDYERAEAALAERDTSAAARYLDEALAAWPTYPAALASWARLQLARGRPHVVIQRLDTMQVAAAVPALQVRLGDAYALGGAVDSARVHYQRARRDVPLYTFDTRARLVLREAAADVPAAIRALVALDSAAVRAGALAALEEAPAAVAGLRGLLLAEAGRYEEAAQLLSESLLEAAVARPRVEGDLLRVQRLVWLSGLAWRAGDPGRAGDYAETAAVALRRRGALNPAARMADVADQMAWISAQRQGTL